MKKKKCQSAVSEYSYYNTTIYILQQKKKYNENLKSPHKQNNARNSVDVMKSQNN